MFFGALIFFFVLAETCLVKEGADATDACGDEMNPCKKIQNCVKEGFQNITIEGVVTVKEKIMIKRSLFISAKDNSVIKNEVEEGYMFGFDWTSGQNDLELDFIVSGVKFEGTGKEFDSSHLLNFVDLQCKNLLVKLEDCVFVNTGGIQGTTDKLESLLVVIRRTNFTNNNKDVVVSIDGYDGITENEGNVTKGRIEIVESLFQGYTVGAGDYHAVIAV